MFQNLLSNINRVLFYLRMLLGIIHKFLTSISFFGELLPLPCLYFRDFINSNVYSFSVEEKSIWPTHLLLKVYDLSLASNANWILLISIDA